MCERWEGRTPKEERPIHVVSLLTYLLIYLLSSCEKDGGDERQRKSGLSYTTASADERASALLSLSGSTKGEATLCRHLPVQENPKRRRRAFLGVQHMWGVVDKGCGYR